MSAASKASENVKSQFHKVPLLLWGKFWFSVFVLCSVYIVCQERVLDNELQSLAVLGPVTVLLQTPQPHGDLALAVPA